MTVDRCAALFPSDSNSACNLQYVAGTRGKEENHFLFGCKSEEDRHIDHMLTGAEEDPRKIAMSRMLDSLLTHTETMTATETMEQEYKDRYDLKRLLREHDYAAGLIAGPTCSPCSARRMTRGPWTRSNAVQASNGSVESGPAPT